MMNLIALDLTAELAPLIWTMEAFMLVAVVWLVGMFFADQMQTKSKPNHSTSVVDTPGGPNAATDDEERIAA